LNPLQAISGGCREERLFSMEMEGALPQEDARETPTPLGVGHLDFGSREGGGVVGPKLDSAMSRQSDRFKVQEGAHLLTMSPPPLLKKANVRALLGSKGGLSMCGIPPPHFPPPTPNPIL